MAQPSDVHRRDRRGDHDDHPDRWRRVAWITAWLWFTVLLAIYAEADGRRARQSAGGHATQDTVRFWSHNGRTFIKVCPSADVRPKNVLVETGDTIPSDGEVIEGIAFVSEAAITGGSAPVLKEPGTDISSSVTGGTQVVSDQLVAGLPPSRARPSSIRMIALVEGAGPAENTNEIALNILLAGLTIIFLIVVVTLDPFSRYAGDRVDACADCPAWSP